MRAKQVALLLVILGSLSIQTRASDFHESLERQERSSDDEKTGVAMVAALCLLGAFLVYIVQGSRASARNDREMAAMEQLSHPGKFKVFGVDRNSKLDVVDFFDAGSADNAKAKAELMGIVVTRIERA